MTLTTYTSGGSIDKTFTNVKMCVVNDDGLIQLMRDDAGVSHLDTLKADYAINITRTTTP